MKSAVYKRLLSAFLALCICIVLLPAAALIEAEAVSGIDSLTCSGFISNSTAQTYIDVMMRYYLNNNSKLRTTLDDGLSVVFMFEGGSDYYWSGNDYNNSAYDVRDQAVVIVVQKNSSGKAYIDFYSENCSSIPGDPSWCTGAAYSGSTTILDGIYPFYTTNHTGPYAALQLDMSATNGYGYYTPLSDPDGYKNGASGINVHTRASDIAAGSDLGWAWSEGCQVIGSGSTASNVFNDFMQSVTGISWDPWIDYYASPKNLNTFSYTGTHMGYYVVDRQLGLMNNDGTEYGSGSLTALYTKTALKNITAYSTSARANADFNTNYMERCTKYPAHIQVQAKYNASLNSYPCAAGTNGSEKIETAVAGDYYTVTGLYKNHADNYWYELITPSGKTAYIYNTSATYVRTYSTDITLSGASYPDAHVKGNTFSVKGTIGTKYSGLTNVSVWVHSGYNVDGAQVTGLSADVSGSSYSLGGSTIDANTCFDELDCGKYTYVIRASYQSYFVKDEYTLMYAYGTKELHQNYFTVIPSSVSQDSCSHSYDVTITKSPTCTAAGKGIYSCTKCGYILTAAVDAIGHSYGSWNTTDATCTQNGSKVRTCATCGYTQQETLQMTGHQYELQILEGNCLREEDYYFRCTVCGAESWPDLTALRSQWNTTIPEGMPQSLFLSKVQYRFRRLDGDIWKAWSDWSDDAVEATDTCQVEQRTLYQMKPAQAGAHNWSEGVCSLCGLPCRHSYENEYCTNCGYRKPNDALYLFGYINGANYACEEDFENAGNYQFTDGKLIATFSQNSYVAVKTGDNRVWYMTDGYPGDDATSATLYSTAITGERSNKLFVPRGKQITFTVVKNTNGTLTLSYEAADCEHQWENGVCKACGEICDHSVWTHGACGSCGLICSHESWTEGACDRCTLQCKHNYQDNLCAICGKERTEKDYYLFGFINGSDYGCEGDYNRLGDYLFIDGTLSTTFRQDSYVAIKTHDNKDWYMTQTWLGEDATSATLYQTTTGAYEKLFVPSGKLITFTLVDNGDNTLTLSYEAADCPHSQHDRNGQCSQCGTQVGHDYERTVTEATCTTAGSIVDTCRICGSSNSETIPAKGHRIESAVTAPTCSLAGYTTHICTVCKYSYTDNPVPPAGHQYENGVCKNCGRQNDVVIITPTITLKFPTVSFEDVIVMNVYYTASDLQDVVEMGLITYDAEPDSPSVNTAKQVVPGYGWSEADQMYFSTTAGIAPKDIGDNIHFAVYYKLTDGSYGYSRLTHYSPKTYAMNLLAGSNENMKPLVVSMLNYGAAAQTYFGYKTDSLMNAGLSETQKGLVEAYRADMISSFTAADAAKAGSFINNGGYVNFYPTISFEGAFRINYYYSPSAAVKGDVTMYIWNQTDFSKEATLSKTNATKVVTMSKTDSGEYLAVVEGIAAKDLDKGVYVSICYSDGTTDYCSGVIGYSIGKYCTIQADRTGTIADLSAACAVYGYYAKQLFYK